VPNLQNDSLHLYCTSFWKKRLKLELPYIITTEVIDKQYSVHDIYEVFSSEVLNFSN
jgi:hypothetical protein